MRITWNWIQAGFAAIGAFLGWFFGDIDGLLVTLIVLVIVDYLTGVLRAINMRKLSSEIGAKGISKKIIVFLLVGVAHMLDVEILGAGDALRNAVIFFYISNEGISIIENAVAIGLPVPDKLGNILQQLSSKKTEEKENDSK